MLLWESTTLSEPLSSIILTSFHIRVENSIHPFKSIQIGFPLGFPCVDNMAPHFWGDLVPQGRSEGNVEHSCAWPSQCFLYHAELNSTLEASKLGCQSLRLSYLVTLPDLAQVLPDCPELAPTRGLRNSTILRLLWLFCHASTNIGCLDIKIVAYGWACVISGGNSAGTFLSRHELSWYLLDGGCFGGGI